MRTTRTQVRRYVSDMLKDNVDVGGRVYTDRTTSVDAYDLPAVFIDYGTEQNVTIAGSKLLSNVKQKLLKTKVTVVIDAIDGEDYIDYIVSSIESSFSIDPRLAIRLPGYDANDNYDGLVFGYKFNGDDGYNPSTKADRRTLSTSINIELIYSVECWVDKRRKSFDVANIEVVSV